MSINSHRKFSGQQYNKVKNQEIIACLTSTPAVEVDSVPSLLLGIASLCSFFLSPKSLQRPSKSRPYFKKVSPRSQIRDSGAILQHSDIQVVSISMQNIKP